MCFKRLENYLKNLSPEFYEELGIVVRNAKRQLRESILGIVAIFLMGAFIVILTPAVKSPLVKDTALNALKLGAEVCFVFLFFIRFSIGQQVEYIKSAIKQLLYLFFWVCAILLFGDFIVESFKSNPAETSAFAIALVVAFLSAKQVSIIP